MAYWFGGFSLFGFVLLNSSAELCAGLLAPGCRILGILQADFSFMMPMRVIWHAWCLFFGVLGDAGATLGRSWDDPGKLGSTNKDTARSRLRLYRFLVDLGVSF